MNELLVGPIGTVVRLRLNRPHFASSVEVVLIRRYLKYKNCFVVRHNFSSTYRRFNPDEHAALLEKLEKISHHEKEIESQKVELGDLSVLIAELTRQNTRLRQQVNFFLNLLLRAHTFFALQV